MFGFGRIAPYKATIVALNKTIKELREQNTSYGIKLHEKNLEITRLAAENAVLKQEINKLQK